MSALSTSDKVIQVNLKKHVPEGPVTEDAFEIVQVPAPKPEDLKNGEVLLRAIYVSVDPYMRSRFINKPGYLLGPFQIGQPIESGIVALILASKNPKYKEGDAVQGLLPWVEVLARDPKDLNHVQKDAGFPWSYYLGACGMPGMTAYAGLEKIAEPKKGEVALVSAAAGAVGQLVCQILKNVRGAKVIGIAGGSHKIEFLKKEIHVDSTIDYKTESLEKKIKEEAPDGLDIYWDNVGGETLELALRHSRPHMRIPVCGMISQYDLPEQEQAPLRGATRIVWNRIRIQGFIIGDIWGEYYDRFQKDMPEWIRQGKIKVVEDLVKGGLRNAPKAFIGMMKGENLGKRVVEATSGIDPYRK
ncbi:hypothetical protein SpCBS45565_g02174 [Spizellomyces sp. 'palustris']|nr:hypothetical protein SpCBS45565_g02174 [Spizellomyces sp. 'palustris']